MLLGSKNCKLLLRVIALSLFIIITCYLTKIEYYLLLSFFFVLLCHKLQRDYTGLYYSLLHVSDCKCSWLQNATDMCLIFVVEFCGLRVRPLKTLSPISHLLFFFIYDLCCIVYDWALTLTYIAYSAGIFPYHCPWLELTHGCWSRLGSYS